MKSCPNLELLDVFMEPRTEGISFERMAEFWSRVFPHLPQKSNTEVRVVYWLGMKKRDFWTLLADQGEAIRKNFVEEMPKDEHIDADSDVYYSDIYDEVSLCRATRWNRGQKEGIEPWRVILQINTYEE